jgi:thioredoxin
MISKNKIITMIAFLTFFIISTTCEKDKIKTLGENMPMQRQLQNIMQQSEKSTEQITTTESEHVKTIGSLEELNSIVENTPGKLLIFDLYADWCMPCRILAPVYDTMAKVHAQRASFYRVDVQRQKEIADAFNVHSIPLVVFIKDKEMVHTVPGLNPREHYEKVISTCGSEVPAAECIKKLKEVL